MIIRRILLLVLLIHGNHVMALGLKVKLLGLDEEQEKNVRHFLRFDEESKLAKPTLLEYVVYSYKQKR